MPEFEVTLSGVAARLAALSREMADLTHALGELDRKATEAKERYSMEYQKAYLLAGEERENGRPLSVDTRKSKAFIATHSERVAADALECSVRDKRAQIRAIESAIEVGRSVGSLVKSEIELDKVR